MSIMSAIFAPVMKVVDKIVPDKDLAIKIKAGLQSEAMAEARAVLDGQVKVLLAEMNGSWLQRNWRPMTMLAFVIMIMAHWFGFSAVNLTEPERLAVFDLVKIGLGGYVFGRSAEKVAKNLNLKKPKD